LGLIDWLTFGNVSIITIDMSNSPQIPSARQTKAIRVYLGQGQGDFARNCLISITALMDHEKGHRRTSAKTLAAIAIYVATLGFRFDGSDLILEE
jgi:hypothetical protein